VRSRPGYGDNQVSVLAAPRDRIRLLTPAPADARFATEALVSSIVWSSVLSSEGLVAMSPIRAQGLVQPVGPAP
jgi:hypothetical protein